MTLNEAMQRGLTVLCKAHWAFKDDRLALEKFGEMDGKAYYGPWATLVSPQSAKALGESYHEQQVLIFGDTTDDWVEYTPVA